MKLSIIVAMAKNRVIGRQNRLPWHLPEDLKRFKKLTMGQPVIMGRKTYESIGKPLPGRTNIVLSRNAGFHPPGVVVVREFQDALDHARSLGADEAFVIGGAEMYRLALPLADRLYVTRVKGHFEGDSLFPETDFEKDFQTAGAEEHPDHVFFTFERKSYG